MWDAWKKVPNSPKGDNPLNITRKNATEVKIALGKKSVSIQLGCNGIDITFKDRYGSTAVTNLGGAVVRAIARELVKMSALEDLNNEWND